MPQLNSDEIERLHEKFLSTLVEPIDKHAFEVSSFVDIKNLDEWPVRHYELDLNDSSTFLAPPSEDELLQVMKNESRFNLRRRRPFSRRIFAISRAECLFQRMNLYLTGRGGMGNGMMLTKTLWQKFYP